VVVGGGLAGIAAAVRLAHDGVGVTLVETRKRLGGRATSFIDPTTGHVLDNCQHVLMGCCTNLIDLYRRLGVADRIQWHRRLYFAGDHGVVDQMEADDLPAPMHMFRSLMGFRSISLAEKIAIGRGMLAILRLGRAGRQRLHDMSFGRWLADHHQPEGAIQKFWSVIVTSALNEQVDKVDAAYAVQVFQEGFLANESAYVVGLPAVPLADLYDTVSRVIEAAGGAVLRSARVEKFFFEDHRVAGLSLADGRRLDADLFVVALPYNRLAKLCSAPMCHEDLRLQRLDAFGASPIIGIHLWFESSRDRPVMSLPHLIMTRGHLQWLFNKGYDEQMGGQHLHGVISAAYGLVNTPGQEIIALAVAEIRQALGGSARAAAGKLLCGRVIKEKRATFSAGPGMDPMRPAARGQIDNLYLAGDWCQTGWPATMEGATRSGYLAAAAVMEDLCGVADESVRPLVADLAPHVLCQFCGL